MHNSSYLFIEQGLQDLVKVIGQKKIKSIALPPLGAGQGGLEWQKVKKMIIEELGGLEIDIIVYEPGLNSIAATTGTSVVNLSKPRALILALIQKYRVLGFDLSLLEIQKLAYFLQRVGQTELKLHFKKSHYGPYAHNLQHLLHKLENDYILTAKPILDSKPFDTIYFNSQRTKILNNYIDVNCTVRDKEQFEIVEKIIQGFESPFGLELLATVDWIIKENENNKNISTEFIRDKIGDWSKRKADSFTDEHIRLALNHLKSFKTALHYLN